MKKLLLTLVFLSAPLCSAMADPNAALVKQASDIVKRYPAIIEHSIKNLNLNQAQDINTLKALKNQATTQYAQQFIQSKINELESKINLIEQKAPSCIKY